MYNERCENCVGPKDPIGRSLNQQHIITSADCRLGRGETLLMLLSFYAHTKNKYLRLRVGDGQNRAVLESVNSVYTQHGKSEMKVG